MRKRIPNVIVFKMDETDKENFKIIAERKRIFNSNDLIRHLLLEAAQAEGTA